MAEKNPIQSAGRIFAVMELLAEEGSMGVTEIGHNLELNKSTVHRLLASLISMGYVRKETNEKYALTFKLVNLGESVRAQNDVVSMAHAYIKELSAKAGETVHLVQREGGDIIYIDKVESNTNSSIRMVSRVGLTYPVFTTGVGKAMLAYMEEDRVEAMWEAHEHQKITAHTIIDFAEFNKELQDIRERGYALDNEENELGVRCIAGSIFNHKGKAENAFSISAPVSRMSDARIDALSDLVLEYRQRISEVFGYRGNVI